MGIVVKPGVRYVLALCLATGVSVALLGSAYYLDPAGAPLYLMWNLLLAWVPFWLAVWLRLLLRRKYWSSWEGMAVSAVWLAFLPNSFYMVSDFIHLPEMNRDYLLLYTVTFTAFVVTALVLGLSSLYVVHTLLRRRIAATAAWGWLLLIVFICCVAIYIGRDLRWNSWDVLVDPAGLLFDLSWRLVHPSIYRQILNVIAPFYLLITSLYAVVWYARKAPSL